MRQIASSPAAISFASGSVPEAWERSGSPTSSNPFDAASRSRSCEPASTRARTLARFDQERQALALMDHPNIAKVFDAGIDAGPVDQPLEDTHHDSAGPIPSRDADLRSTRASRPYVVMELIEGDSITQYCDSARMSPRSRLELFIPVCHAVQHAHQKGIIHRDLKPSNILLGLYDGKPVPKVIDFGIAKTTGPRLTEQSVNTEDGAVIGTLEYMSPEQAELGRLDVDTRSDVYSLGVVLYELLTGTTPLQRSRMKDAGLWELLRMIREVEPARPSLRLNTTEELPAIAANRGLEPKKLSGLVSGELDWIVMKCLDKDRERRYQTANDLAFDLERYLADLPVEASPPSAAYRLRKFLRRHRGPVAAASLTFLALAGGIIGTSIGLKLASDRLALVEAEKRRADEERSIAKAVDNFLQKDLLGQADIANQSSGVARDRNITVRELLDRAAQGLGTRFQGQDRTEAAIRLTLGRAYRALGEYPEAQTQMERSLAIRLEKLGPAHPDTLEGMQSLAGLALDRGEHGEAQRLYEQVLEVRRTQRGPHDPVTLQSKNDLGLTYLVRGQFDKAESLLRDALDARRVRLGPVHLDTLESAGNLAELHIGGVSSTTRPSPCSSRRLKDARTQLGPDHPRTLIGMNNLAGLYLKWGQYDKSESLLNEVLEIRRAKRGPEHPETLQTLHDLGVLYQMRGEYERAETVYKQVLASRRASPDAQHPDVLSTMQQLASVYMLQHRPDQAEPLFKDVLAAQRATQSSAHPETIITMANLGVLYRDNGRYGEAEPLLREAVARSRETNGIGHPTTHTAIAHLTTLYRQLGKPQLTEALLRELVDFLRDHPGPGAYLYGNELGELAENLILQKKYAEAEPFARDCLAIRGKNRPDGWTTFFTRSLIGQSLLGQKKYAEAEPFLVQGYEGMKSARRQNPARRQV